MKDAQDGFLPSNRKEWTALVRPPAGYRLDCAIGTSFGLDFTALTALLLAMLDHPADEASWEQQARRLQAITSLDDRVRVLVQRGQIHADIRPSNRVFALLDRIVADVYLKNASFHPKVWVLKYLPRQPMDLARASGGENAGTTDEAVYRLLCSSKNLTLSSNWEAVASLDGSVAHDGGKAATQMGASVAKFLEEATAETDGLTRPLRALLRELPRVAFSTSGSSAMRACDFLWQWPTGKPLMNSVASGGKAALVVSPFARKGALLELAKRFKTLHVVSRQEELDAFWDASIERVIPRNNVWVVKADAADEDPAETGGPVTLDLHAKLLLCEYGRSSRAARTETWLGSANASPSGWGRAGTDMPKNCEAMLRFSPGIRPELFLEQFVFRRDGTEAKTDTPALNGWIEPYVPRPKEPATEQQRIADALDAARRALAAVTLSALLQRRDGDIAIVLRVDDQAALSTLFADHPAIDFHAMPLGLADGNEGRWADFAVLAEGDVTFEHLVATEVGALLLVRLTHRPSGEQRLLVLRLTLEVEEDFWTQRRTDFLKANLTPKDFRVFLHSILFDGVVDQEPDEEPEGDDGGRHGAGSGPRAKSLLDEMPVEDVLQACTRDRERINEVDRLVEMFAGTEHIDASFLTFWANFRGAVRQAEKGARR